jgi:glycosyl-4,4'-diaponeurosporenoate acyltransferase
MRLPRLVKLSSWGTLVANVLWWAVAHAGTGYAAHRWPPSRLQTDGWLLRGRAFEPRLYRRLRVPAWKDRLPEAGAVFDGGISKRHLPDSIETFVVETRRAELAHWWAMAAAPVSAVWNPWLGAVLMVAYGIAANAPFIVIQRYNRPRAQRVLSRRGRLARRASTDVRRGEV